jgi:hypothetical protein
MRWLAAVVVAIVACSSPPSPVPIASHVVAPPPAPPEPIMGGYPMPPRQLDLSKIDATGMPATLATAAAALFRIGLADPRDCTYREVDIATGSVWSGDGGTLTTHAWVLPHRDARWAVAWNGLVYPILRAGAVADVRADVAAILERERDDKAGKKLAPLAVHNGEAGSISHQTGTPLKILLLLRLGETTLARDLYTEAGIGKLYEEKETDQYLLFAGMWAWQLFERAITAHMRGADEVAVASARTLTPALPLLDAEGDHRGFTSKREGTFFGWAEPLPGVLADAERRVAQPARAPLPEAKRLVALPVGERVKLLVDHLDDVSARQDGQPGGVDLASDPIVEALIQAGADAVEPLIDVLEKDTRLTRSVHFHRDFGRHRSTIGVHEAAYVALAGILEQSFFEPASTGDDLSGRGMAGRKKVADAIRTYWAKWKMIPREQRWFDVLADDAASVDDWLDAGGKIVTGNDVVERRGSMFGTGTRTTVAGAQPGLRGDALRARTNPSVTELFVKRTQDARADIPHACVFARMLGAWDRPAGKPVMLREQARAIAASKASLAQGHCIWQITVELAEAGELAALDRYAAWIAGTRPPGDYLDQLVFQPLWLYPDRPAIAKASETLFGAGSPWLPLVPDKPDAGRDRAGLLETGLLATTGFNRHVVATLADAKIVGTVETRDDAGITIRMRGGSVISTSSRDPNTPPNIQHDIRRSDYYAWTIASHDDKAPRFELHWPIAQRDAALAQMKTWVLAQKKQPGPVMRRL